MLGNDISPVAKAYNKLINTLGTENLPDVVRISLPLISIIGFGDTTVFSASLEVCRVGEN